MVFCYLPNFLSAQYQLSSMTSLDKYQLIPAYAGMEGSLYAVANYRSQWQQIEGMPIYRSAQAHLPMYAWNGGIGFQFYSYSKGAHSENKASVSYNYVIDQKWALLSFGGSFGATQFKLRGEDIKTPDGTYFDNFIDHNDPTLSQENIDAWNVNYSLSYYMMTRFFEGGINLAQFMPVQYRLYNANYTQNILVSTFWESSFALNSNITISPSIKVQTNFVTWQTELFGRIDYSDNIIAGLGVRGMAPSNFDAIITMIGWKFNENYQLAYSYDIGISSLRSAHIGNHELMFVYNMNRKIGDAVLPKRIFNPRYM